MREYNPIYKYGMSERRKKVKKKALYKKWMSMLLAGVVTTTGFMGGTVTLRAAETTNWILLCQFPFFGSCLLFRQRRLLRARYEKETHFFTFIIAHRFPLLCSGA